MGIIIRQSFKASLVAYVGVVIGTFNALFLSTRILSQEELGLTRVLFEVGLLFASLAHLGTPYMTDKFFPYFRNAEQKHSGFLVFLLGYSLAGFAAFTGLFFVFKPFIIRYYQQQSPLLVDYIYFILSTTFFWMYINLLEAYSRIHSRIVVPAIIREIFLKAGNGLLLIAYSLQWIDFRRFVWLSVGSYGVAVLLLFFYIGWLGKLYLRPDFSLIRGGRLKEMSGYGFFIVIGGVGAILAQKIDAVVLPHWSGLELAAIYGIAFNIANAIEIPRRSISQISSPIISQAWKNQDFVQLSDIYKKSALNQLIAGSLLFLLVAVNLDEIFALLPKGEKYVAGKNVVLLMGFARLLDMGCGPSGEMILYSPRFRFATLVVVLLAIMTVASNNLLIPLFPVNGSALATALSVGIFVGMKVGFVWWKFKLQPFTTATLWVLGFGLLAAGAVWFLPGFGNTFLWHLVSVGVKSFLGMLIFLGLILRFDISPDMSRLVKKYTPALQQKSKNV
jgi:O-antigen/teichoic acid export membrane protein